MHGLSTIISLIIKFFAKLFKAFGINGILIVVLIFEIMFCVGYASETKDDDRKNSEYDFTGIEITEVAYTDPIVEEQNLVSEYDHYYLVKIDIKNRYSEPLSYFTIDAKNEQDDRMICRRIGYYGSDMSHYSTQNCIPEGTEATYTYLLTVGSYQYDETNEAIFYEFGGDKDQFISVAIPK
ncbi:MAG: hypothetical protein E7289_03695 [Lachnospiraceae bacterium]|nr:hypothetical protein [Lachnospiraceae bacterium]